MKKMNNNTSLSIVIPCNDEEDNVFYILAEIKKLEIGNIKEIIFIDDGSKDNTWENIETAKKQNSSINVVGLKLTRNFGKESALAAGLEYSSGELVLTIDCDLQHPVHLIPDMLSLLVRNPDIKIVNATKKKRQHEGVVKSIAVKFYYFILNASTGLDLKNHSDFKLLDRSVVAAYLKLKENNKFYRGLTQWLGFNSLEISFLPNNRRFGKNSWSTLSLFKYAKKSILSFSYLPLKAITWIGLFALIFSIVLTIDTLIKTFSGNSAKGFPTVILLQLGIGSLILISLGVIAEYLAEIYTEIKSRPGYIIDKETKDKK
jgi:dolichol-phosphate mannosyltransferase